MNELVTKLHDYRLERHITQMELADMLGVHFATVNRWFNDVFEPSQLQAYQIEKLLKKKPTAKKRR